jgi:hypothetical protein
MAIRPRVAPLPHALPAAVAPRMVAAVVLPRMAAAVVVPHMLEAVVAEAIPIAERNCSTRVSPGKLFHLKARFGISGRAFPFFTPSALLYFSRLRSLLLQLSDPPCVTHNSVR